MEYIHRLPFILGASMSVIVGLFGYENGVAQKEAVIRMAISMLIFFVIGMFLRNIIENTMGEIDNKRKEEENLKRESNEKKHRDEDTNQEQSKIDYRTSDYGEDFEPLTVSEIIKTKTDS
jgi:divalent metal cation (Fe/Co/Zn/Cd) transporter